MPVRGVVEYMICDMENEKERIFFNLSIVYSMHFMCYKMDEQLISTSQLTWFWTLKYYEWRNHFRKIIQEYDRWEIRSFNMIKQYLCVCVLFLFLVTLSKELIGLNKFSTQKISRRKHLTTWSWCTINSNNIFTKWLSKSSLRI